MNIVKRKALFVVGDSTHSTAYTIVSEAVILEVMATDERSIGAVARFIDQK